MHRAVPIAFVLGLAVVAAGCGPRNKGGDDDEDLTELVLDSAASTSAENDAESMTASLVAVSGGGLSPASVDLASGVRTTGVGDIARGIYLPAGCVTAANDAATKNVSYTFDGCLGPYGLFGIRGKVNARYDVPEPNHLVLDITADDLRVNRATVDWTAHADIVAVRAQRTMKWKATMSGTTARGTLLERQNEKTITWDAGSQCVSLSGFSEGNLTGKRVRVEIPAFKRCRGACPEAGSEIKVTHLETGKTASVRFNADDAVYTNASGKQTVFTPACRQ